MEKHVWGQTPDGEDVVVYELTGTNGMRASVMNYGANLLTLFVPDKNRDCKDIVLGYEHLEDYFTMLSLDAASFHAATASVMPNLP